jgi:hypothetical protein
MKLLYSIFFSIGAIVLMAQDRSIEADKVVEKNMEYKSFMLSYFKK